MKNNRYLQVKWSVLLTRYASIYLPLAILIWLSNQQSVFLVFTLFFWMICCSLFLIERFSSYYELDHDYLVQHYVFLERKTSLANILSLKKGRAAGVIGQPKTIDIEFLKRDGSRGIKSILLSQYKISEIERFVEALRNKNQKIQADVDLFR